MWSLPRNLPREWFCSCERKKVTYEIGFWNATFFNAKTNGNTMTYPLKTSRFHAHHINVGRTNQQNDDLRTANGAHREIKWIGMHAMHGHIKVASSGKMEHWYLVMTAMTKIVFWQRSFVGNNRDYHGSDASSLTTSELPRHNHAWVLDDMDSRLRRNCAIGILPFDVDDQQVASLNRSCELDL